MANKVIKNIKQNFTRIQPPKAGPPGCHSAKKTCCGDGCSGGSSRGCLSFPGLLLLRLNHQPLEVLLQVSAGFDGESCAVSVQTFCPLLRNFLLRLSGNQDQVGTVTALLHGLGGISCRRARGRWAGGTSAQILEVFVGRGRGHGQGKVRVDRHYFGGKQKIQICEPMSEWLNLGAKDGLWSQRYAINVKMINYYWG